LTAFHRCESPKEATKLLTDALRSNKPLDDSDRERLAKMIEGRGYLPSDSTCEIVVRKRRSRKRLTNRGARYDALDRLHELVSDGKGIEDAAKLVCKEPGHAGVEWETLSKEYRSYRIALNVNSE
jgi:hypothetical protein